MTERDERGKFDSSDPISRGRRDLAERDRRNLARFFRKDTDDAVTNEKVENFGSADGGARTTTPTPRSPSSLMDEALRRANDAKREGANDVEIVVSEDRVDRY